jgi:hypothetical protein
MGLRNERHRAKTLPVRQQAGHLSAEQRQSLEGDGYLLVPSLLDETVLGPIASRLEQLVCQTVAVWDADPGRATAEQVERGVVRLQLARADPDFAPCCQHPLLSDAAAAVLGDIWYLAALSLRAPARLRPPGAASRLRGAADRWAVADAIGHVVHHRVHR